MTYNVFGGTINPAQSNSAETNRTVRWIVWQLELDVSSNRLKKLPSAKSKKKNCIHYLDVSH